MLGYNVKRHVTLSCLEMYKCKYIAADNDAFEPFYFIMKIIHFSREMSIVIQLDNVAYLEK